MSKDSSRPRPVKPGTEYSNRLLDDSTQESCVARWARTVRIPGRTPGACELRASLPVFPCHAQPPQGGHVTKHRSSQIHWSSLPSYLPVRTPSRALIRVPLAGQRGVSLPAKVNPMTTLRQKSTHCQLYRWAWRG